MDSLSLFTPTYRSFLSPVHMRQVWASTTQGSPAFEPDRSLRSGPKDGSHDPLSVGAKTSKARSLRLSLKYFDAAGRQSTTLRSNAFIYEIGVKPATINRRDELGKAFGHCDRMAALLIVAVGQV